MSDPIPTGMLNPHTGTAKRDEHPNFTPWELERKPSRRHLSQKTDRNGSHIQDAIEEGLAGLLCCPATALALPDEDIIPRTIDNSNMRSTACLPCGKTCSFSQNGCASTKWDPYKHHELGNKHEFRAKALSRKAIIENGMDASRTTKAWLRFPLRTTFFPRSPRLRASLMTE
jgi:hypothetical protein